MTNSINFVSVKKKHLIGIGDNLFETGVPNKHSRAREYDFGVFDLLFATQATA